MSIVAVHGPNTWGSGAVQGTGPTVGVVDPTNGLKWDFGFASPSLRPDAEVRWEFLPDGSPNTVVWAVNPPATTFLSAGEKTVKATITNTTMGLTAKAVANKVATLTLAMATAYKVGQSIVVAGAGAPFDGTFIVTAVAGDNLSLSYALDAPNTTAGGGGTVQSDPAMYPPAGTYIDTYTVAAGPAPMSVEGQSAEEPTNGNGAYYPSDHTVDEVKTEADNNADDPAYIQSLLDAELADKNRSTLVAYLESLLPYDPGAHTVADVVQHATDHPDEVAAIIAAEQAGKNRTTLLSQLEALRTT